MASETQLDFKNLSGNINASKILAMIFGIYGGIFGFEHGIGEILQGNSTIENIKFYAYKSPGLPFPFGREPAMTLIPIYLITGINNHHGFCA
jgi:hypothetical protein